MEQQTEKFTEMDNGEFKNSAQVLSSTVALLFKINPDHKLVHEYKKQYAIDNDYQFVTITYKDVERKEFGKIIESKINKCVDKYLHRAVRAGLCWVS